MADADAAIAQATPALRAAARNLASFISAKFMRTAHSDTFRSVAQRQPLIRLLLQCNELKWRCRFKLRAYLTRQHPRLIWTKP